jgi:antitoxin HigA-1
MKNPPHPGLHVRDCLEAHKLSVAKGAEALGVSTQALNNLLKGKRGVSPDMSVRLSKGFGGKPATWLKLQLDYDVAQAERMASKIHVKRVRLLV